MLVVKANEGTVARSMIVEKTPAWPRRIAISDGGTAQSSRPRKGHQDGMPAHGGAEE